MKLCVHITLRLDSELFLTWSPVDNRQWEETLKTFQHGQSSFELEVQNRLTFCLAQDLINVS